MMPQSSPDGVQSVGALIISPILCIVLLLWGVVTVFFVMLLIVQIIKWSHVERMLPAFNMKQRSKGEPVSNTKTKLDEAVSHWHRQLAMLESRLAEWNDALLQKERCPPSVGGDVTSITGGEHIARLVEQLRYKNSGEEYQAELAM